jgi:hypothetical protein
MGEKLQAPKKKTEPPPADDFTPAATSEILATNLASQRPAAKKQAEGAGGTPAARAKDPMPPPPPDPNQARPGDTTPFAGAKDIQSFLAQSEQPIVGGLQDIIKQLGGLHENKNLPPEFRGHMAARNQALAGALQHIVDSYQKAIPAMGIMQFLQNLPSPTQAGAGGLAGIPADMLTQISTATNTPVPKPTA